MAESRTNIDRSVDDLNNILKNEVDNVFYDKSRNIVIFNFKSDAMKNYFETQVNILFPGNQQETQKYSGGNNQVIIKSDFLNVSMTDSKYSAFINKLINKRKQLEEEVKLAADKKKTLQDAQSAIDNIKSNLIAALKLVTGNFDLRQEGQFITGSLSDGSVVYGTIESLTPFIPNLKPDDVRTPGGTMPTVKFNIKDIEYKKLTDSLQKKPSNEIARTVAEQLLGDGKNPLQDDRIVQRNLKRDTNLH